MVLLLASRAMTVTGNEVSMRCGEGITFHSKWSSGCGRTVRVTLWLVVPLPLVRLVNVTALEYTPAARLLAFVLMETVILVLSPAARVPPVAVKSIQSWLELIDQLKGMPPLLVNV